MPLSIGIDVPDERSAFFCGVEGQAMRSNIVQETATKELPSLFVSYIIFAFVTYFSTVKMDKAISLEMIGLPIKQHVIIPVSSLKW
jgi:hypothetical protein